MAKYLRVVMGDGTYDIPLEIIARSRASHYADEYGGDVERSLAVDTMPLFASDPGEADDWASNNVNWSDVNAHAVKVADPPRPNLDREEGWSNGDKSIIEK